MAYQIQVMYFAAARDLAGCAEESLELPAAVLSDAALRELLAQRHARLAPYLGRMRFAVNDELHVVAVEIRAGDQVSVLPPVAGGSASEPGAPLCGLRSEPLSVDEALRAVMHPGAGGIVVFLGAVRDHSQQCNEPAPALRGGAHNEPAPALRGGARNEPAPAHRGGAHNEPAPAHRGGAHNEPAPAHRGGARNEPAPALRGGARSVSRLDYEAHPRLAEAELRRVLEQVAGEHPGARLSALHRVGSLAVGDLAVVVAASAAHRAEAFAACRAAIDRIKQTVPIWKQEWAADGSALWVNLGE